MVRRKDISRLNSVKNAAEKRKITSKESVCEPAKDRKESLIKKTFSRDFNSPKLYMLIEEFTTDFRINAKGRVYVRAALFFISIMYLIDESLTYSAGLTLIALLWLTVPAALTLSAPVAEKMVGNKYDLYDILAGTGIYIIVFFSLAALESVAVKFLQRAYPHLFTGFTAITGLIIIAAIISFVIEVLIMLKER